MTTSKDAGTAPIKLENPITGGIVQHEFSSSLDASPQTFLEKDFCQAAPNGERLVFIYLHGAKSHQEQGMTAGIYNGAFERWEAELASRSAVYICPEYRGNSWMGPAAEADLQDILLLVRERYPVRRLILAGGSMGGTSALIFASRFPKAVDGVIALCPCTDPVEFFNSLPNHFLESYGLIESYGGSPAKVPGVYSDRTSRNRADVLASLPVAIVHGSADAIIGVEHSRGLVRQLLARGARCHYTEIPEGDHDAPVQVPLSELLDFVISSATPPAHHSCL
jgi:dipeptidyl aminopeptidase/acylaminoacyl peptidase